MSSKLEGQESKKKPLYPVYFKHTQDGNTVLPNNVIFKTITVDARGKKLKKPLEIFNVMLEGRELSFPSLSEALEVSGYKMVQCPHVEGWTVPQGDVFRLQAHLRYHDPETFAALLEESKMPKFFKNLYVYPDGYYLERRFISSHLPEKSFATKDELDRELKRVNPRDRSEFHLEKSCPHGQDCRGIGGSCFYNHTGAQLCRHEKDSTNRCGKNSCGYNHWSGRARFVVGKRIAIIEKLIEDESDDNEKAVELVVDSIVEKVIAMVDDPLVTDLKAYVSKCGGQVSVVKMQQFWKERAEEKQKMLAKYKSLKGFVLAHPKEFKYIDGEKPHEKFLAIADCPEGEEDIESLIVNLKSFIRECDGQVPVVKMQPFWKDRPEEKKKMLVKFKSLKGFVLAHPKEFKYIDGKEQHEKLIALADSPDEKADNGNSSKSSYKLDVKGSSTRKEYLERLKAQQKSIIGSTSVDSPPLGGRDFPQLGQGKPIEGKKWAEIKAKKWAETKAKSERRLKAALVLQDFYSIIKTKTSQVAEMKTLVDKEESTEGSVSNEESMEGSVSNDKPMEESILKAAEKQALKQLEEEMDFGAMITVNEVVKDPGAFDEENKSRSKQGKKKKVRKLGPEELGFT